MYLWQVTTDLLPHRALAVSVLGGLTLNSSLSEHNSEASADDYGSTEVHLGSNNLLDR